MFGLTEPQKGCLRSLDFFQTCEQVAIKYLTEPTIDYTYQEGGNGCNTTKVQYNKYYSSCIITLRSKKQADLANYHLDQIRNHY